MNIKPARTLAAALTLTLIPATALAEVPDAPVHKAILTALATPVGVGDRPVVEASTAPNRSVVVDAASARLFMMENGRVVDSMKVIVGKPGAATPELRSTIHYATFNPYWNVPVDLARSIIAPRVLQDGTAYLEERGYEVVTRFGRGARVLSPESVDWNAVASGETEVYVRQRPGPANSMGEVKVGFTDNDGIYLHDTPKKELFEQANRDLSSGCVRLEDADRFAEWLLGSKAEPKADSPEQHVRLPRPVPIVITYLDDPSSMQVASLVR